MNKPCGIIVFGLNGSGKTTLGRELARILNFKHMDIEDYYFHESEIPYSNPRSRDECLNLMLADIQKHSSFVLTTVKGDLGDTIPQYYKLAVYISAPIELRMKRIKQRSYEIFEGGDMYKQERKFFDFAAWRSLAPIEQWAETLICPIICVDGTVDWRENAESIAKQYGKISDAN